VAKKESNLMAQTIGTIILVVLALVALTAVLNFVLGVLGIVLGLLPLLIKLAIVGAVFYAAWLVFRKLADSNET
jgi:lipopolysaccharide export LptBFGC system permease protein LptF